MSKCINWNAKFLNEISDCTSYKRKKIIQSCTKDNINALTEDAHNILRGNVSVSPEDKLIKRHREKVRHLANIKIPFKKKRQALIQKGGFLPRMVKPALKFSGAVASTVVANAIF